MAVQTLRLLSDSATHRFGEEGRLHRLHRLADKHPTTRRLRFQHSHLHTKDSMVLERDTRSGPDRRGPRPDHARRHLLQRLVRAHRLHRHPRHRLAMVRPGEERVLDGSHQSHPRPDGCDRRWQRTIDDDDSATVANSRIQRCHFHIRQAAHRYLTRRPVLSANKELLGLFKMLSKVTSIDEAARWMAAFTSWEAKWESFLKHRTQARPGTPRPAHVRPGQHWWYTHIRTRRAHKLLAGLIRDNHLFTWLELAEDGYT